MEKRVNDRGWVKMPGIDLSTAMRKKGLVGDKKVDSETRKLLSKSKVELSR